MNRLGLGVLLCAPLAAVTSAQERVLVEWSFDEEGDLEGWQPKNHVADVRQEDGLLIGRATDWDPFITSGLFEIETTPWQRIEVRMRCEEGGQGEFFWTNTEDTEYEGFSPGKETRFSIVRGGFRTYSVYPFWHAEGRIIKLRLDFPKDCGEFAIDRIRIVEPEPPPTVDAPLWTFDEGGTEGWQGNGVQGLRSEGGRLHGRTTRRDGLLVSPQLDVPLDETFWVTVRMRVNGGKFGCVRFATADESGLHSKRFRLRPRFGFHTYNVDMGESARWKGRLLALGLQPTDQPGASFDIDEIRVSDEPSGAPDIDVTYLGPMDAVARAGKPTTIGCMLVNHGGQAAEDVSLTPAFSKLHRVADGEQKTKQVTLDFAVPKLVTWKIVGHHPNSSGPVGVNIVTKNSITPASGIDRRIRRRGESYEFTGRRIQFRADPQLPPADYVPEPKPAKTDYLVGSYYFPGWYSMSRWQCVKEVTPERRPALGWYDEGDPEIADWQIKWAVENGISFFMVDWYWIDGARSLEHWLHEAYMKARWRKHLKFALMWANHNRPGTHSVEDWRKVTQYWIDNYFPLDEYLRIDGKPAVFIWAPANIRRDVGGGEGAAKLYAMSQQMARDAGYEGVYFVAMGDHGDDERVAGLVSEGYAGATTYHWWGDARELADDQMYFPFELVARTSKAAWERHDAVIGERLLYIPTVDTGWASQPWHGDNARVIHDRTPALFEQTLQDAREFADARGRKIIALGPWNEWGEGSYIEPCVEFGFGMLETVRRVFCEMKGAPVNIVPADVGLGPYDFLQTQDQLAWEFDTDAEAEGWGPLMGMGEFRVEGGAMRCRASGVDPAFTGPVLQASALLHPRVLIRMSIDKVSQPGESAQLFWETATSPIGAPNSMRFELVADDEYHDYVLEVGESNRWRGTIRGLRFDPCGTPGANVAIDSIRLLTE